MKKYTWEDIHKLDTITETDKERFTAEQAGWMAIVSTLDMFTIVFMLSDAKIKSALELLKGPKISQVAEKLDQTFEFDGESITIALMTAISVKELS